MENNIMLDKLRDENQRLCNYIDNINLHQREKEKAASRVLWISIITAAFGGFLVATEFAPIPKAKDCGVFKINQKPVTAFVLKPPAAEHPVCPVAPKCEAQVIPEPEKVEATKADDAKPRRRRHYRKRAYWR